MISVSDKIWWGRQTEAIRASRLMNYGFWRIWNVIPRYRIVPAKDPTFCDFLTPMAAQPPAEALKGEGERSGEVAASTEAEAADTATAFVAKEG